MLDFCTSLKALSSGELYITIKKLISNSNWTEWSTIQGVITQIISKSDECEARGQFKNTNLSYLQQILELNVF